MTIDPLLMARSSVLFLQVLASDIPPHHQTTHRVKTDLDGEKAHGKGHQHWKESSRSPDQFESTATGGWFALTGIDTSWEEPCDKKGSPSGCSCCSPVSNCIAGQVHQEP